MLSAVRAAQWMRMTGARWLTLLTTEREVFGSPSSARVGAFYGALEQILGEHLSATQDQQVAPAASEEADAG